MEYAIQINRIFNDVMLRPKFKTGSKSKMESYIQKIKENPIDLQDEIRNEERFLKYPTVTVKEHAPFSTGDVTIIATIDVCYTVVCASNGDSKFPVFGTVLATVCILFITFAIFVLQLAKQSHEKSQIENACYLYTKNGVPDMIQINGNEYHLDTDGKIEGVDRIFLNPYDEIDLARAECIRVNTKE